MRLLWEWPHLIEASLLACHGRVLACSGPCSVRFWDLETGEPLTPPCPCQPYSATHLHFPLPNRLLAVGAGLWEWSPQEARCKVLLGIDPRHPELCYISDPTGSVLVGGVLNRHLTHDLRVLRQGKEVLSRRGDFELVSMAVDRSGRWLVLGGGRRWQRWDLASLRCVQEGQDDEGTFVAAFSPDGTRLAMACNRFMEARTNIFDTADWSRSETVTSRELAPELLWSPDSRWLTYYSGGSSSASGAITVCDRRGTSKLLHPHSGGVLRAAFSPDSEHLAVLAFNGTVAVLELSSGRRVAGLRCAGNAVSVAFGLRGQLVTGGYDGVEEGYNRARIRVWK